MSRTRRHSPAFNGLIGTLVLVVVVLGAMNMSRLPLVRNTNTLVAEFAEAGGLKSGNDVLVSGATVGKVTDVKLEGNRVLATLTLSDEDLTLGEETGANIVTVTLLGRAAVELVPKGEGSLERGDTIPLERTASPYNLTSALAQLTTESEQIDKAALTKALDQLSTTFSETAPEVGRALDGITDLAATVGNNDAALQQLLSRANRVSSVLAGRNTEITQLLTSGQSLLRELNARQDVVISLLESSRALSRELTGLVGENQKLVGPALTELNKVVALLNRNRVNLAKSIKGLRNYATAFGEALSSGPFFDAYVQNLTSPGTLAPVISGVLP